MLKNFLINGQFDGLSLRLSKAEVRSLLGEAEDYSEPHRRIEIWKYGGLEIAFDKAALHFIGLYFKDGTAVVPRALSASRLIHVEERQLKDFKEFLLTNDIDFTLDDILTYDEQTCLRITKSGVGVYFIHNELHSIQIIQK